VTAAKGDFMYDSSGKAVMDEQNLTSDLEKVERTRKQYGQSAFQQAAWRMAVKGGTVHGKNGDEAEYLRDLADISHGDKSIMADNVAFGRGVAMQAGRIDEGGAGFGDTLGIVDDFYQKTHANPNMTPDQKQKLLLDNSAVLRKHVAHSQSAANIMHGGNKPYAVRNQMLDVQRQLTEVYASGDQGAIDRQLATVANMYDMLVQTAPQLAAEFDNNILNWDVDAGVGLSDPGNEGSPFPEPRRSGTAPSIKTLMERSRTSEDFTSRRREYGAGLTPEEIAERQRLGLPTNSPGEGINTRPPGTELSG